MTVYELVAEIEAAAPADRFDVLNAGIPQLDDPEPMHEIIRGDLEELIITLGPEA